MGLGSKLAIVLLTVGCATVFAAEVLKPTELKDFQKNEKLTSENGVFTCNGTNATLMSAKSFPVDPAKKYKLSGKFRAKPGSEATSFYFGYAPLDAKNGPIIPRMICFAPDTLTELVEPAKVGDIVLKVKDASKWNKQTKYSVVAFNAKADFSDMPNREYVDAVQGKSENQNGVWQIALKAPLKKAYDKGTLIRQHMDSGTYIYNGGAGRKNSADWQTFSGIMSGHAKSGNPTVQWWPGTKTARVVILMNYGAKGVPATEFKDIVVETID